MSHFRSGRRCRPRLSILLVALPLAFAARTAQARQVLLVANFSIDTVGEYDATTGATINATFVNGGQGLSAPHGLALGNNHLFVANTNANTVGEYNATTGATINAAFINGTQGLNNPQYLIFVAPVPEPGSLALVAAAATTAVGLWRRRRRTLAAL